VIILQGEYGEHDIATAVPCVPDNRGADQVVELPLSEDERADATDSAAMVRAGIARLN